MSKIQVKESMHLSTEQLLQLSYVPILGKAGWHVKCTSVEEFEAPALHRGLTKDEAYDIFNGYLKADLLDELG